jgi:hypothetical protein
VRTSAPGSGCRRFAGILAARRKAVRVHAHEKAYDPGSPCSSDGAARPSRKLAAERYIWFGGDPIANITVGRFSFEPPPDN